MSIKELLNSDDVHDGAITAAGVIAGSILFVTVKDIVIPAVGALFTNAKEAARLRATSKHAKVATPIKVRTKSKTEIDARPVAEVSVAKPSAKRGRPRKVQTKIKNAA